MPLSINFEVQHSAASRIALLRGAGRGGEAARRSRADRRDALAGGRDGLHVVQLDGDAVQDISWRGLQAPVETYKKKELRAGAAAYLTVVVRSRSGAGSRQRIRRRGSPCCYTKAAVLMPRINTERVRKLADSSVVVHLHPC